jgi:hypothetical protein
LRHAPISRDCLRIARLYSVLARKLYGIDPDAYLRSILAIIADHPINRVAGLLP